MRRLLNVYYKQQLGANPKHWEFGLIDENFEGEKTRQLTYDIVWEGKGWLFRSTDRDPSVSKRYAGKTTLCDISSSPATLEVIRNVIGSIAKNLDPKARDVDCQDYVLEIIDGLVEEGVIKANDPDYVRGRKILARNWRK